MHRVGPWHRDHYIVKVDIGNYTVLATIQIHYKSTYIYYSTQQARYIYTKLKGNATEYVLSYKFLFFPQLNASLHFSLKF